MHMIMCESLSPKILNFTNLELLTSITPINIFPSPLICLSRGTKISENVIISATISSRYENFRHFVSGRNIVKIKFQYYNAAVCTFHEKYSLTDNSMWLFSMYAIRTVPV